MKPFADRLRKLAAGTAFDILARARALECQGVKIIHMEIGEPDFDTPAPIRHATQCALDERYTHYTAAAGLPALRRAIADDVARTRGIPVTGENIIVVPGGKMIIFFTIMALLNPGEEAVYPNPGFPIYESTINFVGGIPVPLRLREDLRFSFDPDEFRSLITPRTKLIIINSPGNPCGDVLTRSDLEVVAAEAQKHDCYVLSDEIYSRILYEGESVSIASLPGMQERTIIVGGFPKTHAMIGWRLGYGVMPRELTAWLSRLVTNSTSRTAAFTQVAGLTAVTGDQSETHKMVEELRRRRDAIVKGLNDIPAIHCCMPRGGFYVFPNISELGVTSRELADKLLYQGSVATLAGTAFGKYGEGFLRLSYATSLETIRHALLRIRETIS
jgi:aspartate/methionine/tyrosine aminotransferase